jgi:hypothetical protein
LEKQDTENVFERLAARMDADRRKDKVDFLAKLESSQEKVNVMLATFYADRKTDNDNMLKEMKAMQENMKTKRI